MTAASMTGTKGTREFLEAACARNLSAQIHYAQRRPSLTARARLLAISDEQLYVDKPQFLKTKTQFRRDQKIIIYLMFNRARYMFRTTVISPAILVDLNAQQRVVGMSLQIPDEITKQQRRAAFRVSMAAREVFVRFHEADPEEPTVCPVNAGRFTGRMTNISVTGMGALVEQADRRRFTPGEFLCAQFDLPDVPGTFILPVEVRHHRVHRDTVYLVGLRFMRCDALETRLQARRIHAFVAVEQRRRLRSRK